MRVLGGTRRRLAALSVIGIGLGVALVVIGLAGLVVAALL
jgi:hypothetical protein